jgi:hypothetical protein
MPTPVTHLVLADEILRGDVLSPAVRRLLTAQRGPFLLGNTAPDVRALSRQARSETHFYTLPRTSGRPAHEMLLAAFPSLSRASALPPARAAFVAGYVVHLLLDEMWLERIFLPCFAEATWGTRRERAFLHNVVRTWMDRRDQQCLGKDVARALREVEPRGWLPFVSDEALGSWRDWLAQQLAPGRSLQTAEVFAQRMGVAVEEVEAVLCSSRQMRERVFCHVPRSTLRAFFRDGRESSVELIHRYVGEGTVS